MNIAERVIRALGVTALAMGVWATSPAAGQEVASPRAMYDGTMRPDLEVNTFSHADKLFPVRVVKRGSKVRALVEAKESLNHVRFEAGGKTYDLYDYLALNRVAGLLVLKNGEIALEDYELGTGRETRWISFSMVKSVVSTLIGAALNDGLGNRPQVLDVLIRQQVEMPREQSPGRWPSNRAGRYRGSWQPEELVATPRRGTRFAESRAFKAAL